MLGPLQATIGGRAVPIAIGKQQVLLAGFLMHANKVVRLGELAHWLWESEQPADARRTTQTHVRRLRQALGGADMLRTVPGGYRLAVGHDEVDLLRFRALAERGATATEPAARASLLRQALAEWRGPALVDVPSDALRGAELSGLAEEHLRARELRIDADLRLGRHADVVAELAVLTAEHPLRETFRYQHMLALHRSGRQADALEAYQDTRRVLADQLGVDPGAELRDLYQAILTSDQCAPDLAAPEPPIVANRHAVPRELPADIRNFVGRANAMHEAVDHLTPSSPSGVPCVVVTGPPGIGKSAFALRTAHELAPRFPDGQLHADLSGPGGAAERVLPRFLAALGLPSERVPADLDGLRAAYRTLLADRKVLVLLDDATSVDQVRPLLPTSSGSAVLVTSRQQLGGLTASHGALRVSLDVLTAEQSLALLAAIAGASRIGANRALSKELIALCGRFPLALRNAATNLLLRGDRGLEDYIAELHGDRIGKLEVDGDPGTGVRAAFDSVHAALSPEVARVFQLLSRMPTADFTAQSVSDIGGVSLDAATEALRRLASCSLLRQVRSQRYYLHGLVRAYAVERARLAGTGRFRDTGGAQSSVDIVGRFPVAAVPRSA
ncbi:BTAD domain-containing putative transcriptional regulator [Actinokineospora sp. HUAS TT18]|uniref:AfsR/SARP family transcriptional regulator n=1 Tax=Actinokineospora sp. HUAS TT18 TaxID=3447451 RepID=UPI003F523CE2